MPFSIDRLPTRPTAEDFAEREKFRKNIKITFAVFCVLTVVFLAVGIYLVADPGKTIL